MINYVQIFFNNFPFNIKNKIFLYKIIFFWVNYIDISKVSQSYISYFKQMTVRSKIPKVIYTPPRFHNVVNLSTNIPFETTNFTLSFSFFFPQALLVIFSTNIYETLNTD